MLETTLATALLCAVVLFLFNLYPASALAIRQSQDQLTAESIGQSLLDDAKSAPFSSLQVGKLAMARVSYSGTDYYPETEIFAVGTDPDALKGLRVTVRWQSPRGARSEQYELILANLES